MHQSALFLSNAGHIKRLRAALRDFLLTHHRPWANGEPELRVAMFHMGRSGSTVLGQMLSAQGEIFWAGEIFEDMQNRYSELMRKPDVINNILSRSLKEPGSLRALIRRDDYPKSYRVYGLETKYLRQQHLSGNALNTSLTDYVALLERNAFTRFIVLRRRNHLRMLVSRAVGRTTGTWHSRATSTAPERVVLPILDWFWNGWKGTLVELLRDLDAQHAELVRLLDGRSVLHLGYEEHIGADPTVAYRAVCNFLDLPATPVPVRLKKTNPFPLSESVQNWDEVVDVLSGTEYAWMLTDEIPPPAA